MLNKKYTFRRGISQLAKAMGLFFRMVRMGQIDAEGDKVQSCDLLVGVSDVAAADVEDLDDEEQAAAVVKYVKNTGHLPLSACYSCFSFIVTLSVYVYITVLP
jgi:hypothetical protein